VILRAMDAAQCHLTAEELHRRVRRGARPIGLATVYRALETFVREGLAEPVHVGDGRVRYGLVTNHHDHLVCLNCGDWEPLGACLLPRTPRRVGKFKVTGHQLDVYGYCAQCQAAGD
jgi:Fe2+ or Zn2+ uptake regulation protein